MKNKAKTYLLINIIVATSYLGLNFRSASYFFEAKKVMAESAYPTIIGITGASQTPCQLSCYVLGVPTCCMGGTMCPTLTVNDCPLFAEVTGAPSGGTTNMCLMSLIAIGKTGVIGGQMLAGGMTPTKLSVSAGKTGVFYGP